MSDEVRNQLRIIYDRIVGPISEILDTFIQQFGEQYVDSNVCTFDRFLEALSGRTLEQMGISSFSGSNDYGSYFIDRDDYEANGRGKPFLEYIPDLGILNYLTPVFRTMLVPSSNYVIMVYFPEVRVTNEYDKFIDIQDLYARVEITHQGKLVERFKMTRTTFPFTHFKSGYAHSHLHVITPDTIGAWDYPCTGEGPIVDTISTLKRNYDINIWGLFVFELSKYVTIESIAGRPYKRLESVGKGDVADGVYNFMYRTNSLRPGPMKSLIDKFALYYASKKRFKMQFVDGEYRIGESPVNTVVNLSNSFIEWYNNNVHSIANVPNLTSLRISGVLREYIVSNNNIYDITSTGGRDLSAAQRVNGKSLFKFKGETIKLKVLVDSSMSPENKSLLLSKEYCEYVLARALTIINYKYGKRQNPRRSASQTQNEASEKPYFI